MNEITEKQQDGYAAESITEKFDWLPLDKQCVWERKFADEMREQLDPREFESIITALVAWDTGDVSERMDDRWEKFLERTEPEWRADAIEEYAEYHDWLDDEDEIDRYDMRDANDQTGNR